LPIRDLFVADDKGRFRFRAPDDAVLEARRPGSPPGRARVDGSAQASHRLVIRLGKPARVATPRITGRVTDAAGKPVAPALVAAEPIARPRNDDWPDTRVQTETDADGRFALDDLSADAYSVVASRP